MKTIYRLTAIVLVIALVGYGLYLFFQNPTVQSWLGLEAGFGRGRRAGEASTQLAPNVEPETGQGEGQGHGYGRGRGAGEGRGMGAGRGQETGFERSDHPDEFPASSGWLGLLGIFLRLAILMAVVIALIKLVRWIGRKTKPNGRVNVENTAA